eukprot:Tbor_TRINITY_DN6019_c1_g8::TRINITY_DN6019_c1_g8_i1::g.11244::m.11244/K05609/UCHL3, YUH1; ubiquitin carboxyl-terminal hydrolase L3
MPKKWFPLESNPDVMMYYSSNLGVDRTTYQFVDVYGTDPDLLAMIPKPAHALLLVYPLSEKSERANHEAAKASTNIPTDLYFSKQTVSNACGTIGLIHALVNTVIKTATLPKRVMLAGENNDGIVINPYSKEEELVWLGKLIKQTQMSTPDQRAAFIEESEELESLHSAAVQLGQTANQDIDADINLHFVTFIHHSGHLWELDGRMPNPIDRGICTEETMMEAAAKTVNWYLNLDPGSSQQMMYAMTALCGVE